MSNNCNCSRNTYSNNVRISDPSGCWDIDQLIGAKVRVKSMPVSNFFMKFDASNLLTIKNIYFRVSIDGKVITVLDIEEYPGKFLTWKDVMVVELCYTKKYKAVCGGFKCGQSDAGYGY